MQTSGAWVKLTKCCVPGAFPRAQSALQRCWELLASLAGTVHRICRVYWSGSGEMPDAYSAQDPPPRAAVMPCGNPGRTGCTLLSWLVVLGSRLSYCTGGWSGAHQASASIFIPPRCTQTIVSISLHWMLSVKELQMHGRAELRTFLTNQKSGLEEMFGRNTPSTNTTLSRNSPFLQCRRRLPPSAGDGGDRVWNPMHSNQSGLRWKEP